VSDCPRVYTIGFSNRSWATTLEILQSCRIQRVVDIRTFPGSRRTPQFNQENLITALPAAGIEYVHLKALGGLRKLRADDPTNAGWRNESFRAYADYMQTEEFRMALEELIRLLLERRVVYACTEAVFWRCHRALVSDALLIRGYEPQHIFSSTKCEAHRLTSFARIDGLRITYP
jgi:uncharacterized protein (DUF488 family)